MNIRQNIHRLLNGRTKTVAAVSGLHQVMAKELRLVRSDSVQCRAVHLQCTSAVGSEGGLAAADELLGSLELLQQRRAGQVVLGRVPQDVVRSP